MTLQVRFIIGFGGILTLIVVLAAVGVWRVNAIDSNLTAINEVNSAKQRYAINFRGSVHDRAIELRDVVLFANETRAVEAGETIDALAAFYAQSAGPLDAMMEAAGTTKEELEILASIKRIEAETLPVIDRVRALRQTGEADQALQMLMEEARPRFMTWLERINTFIDYQEGKNNALTAETRSIASGFALLMIGVATVSVLIGIGFATWNVLSIRPLCCLTTDMLRLADGDLSVAIPEPSGKDEVADITRAVQIFKSNALEAQALRERQETQEHEAKRARQTELALIAQSFEDSVLGIVKNLSSAALKVRGSAETVTSSATETRQKVDGATGAAGEASSNVGTVAASADHLVESIVRIGDQIQSSTDKAREAVSQAEGTNRIVDGLSTKADEIGAIIELISGIASQTNMLALNATIEAARAGDAGKGFAVVAHEVKSLATQTSQATDQISTQIGEIQKETRNAVDAIVAIARTISEISDISTAVRASVEEQNAATQDITRGARDASERTNSVSSAMEDLREAARASGAASDDLLTASRKLEEDAELLGNQVDRFLGDVRAG